MGEGVHCSKSVIMSSQPAANAAPGQTGIEGQNYEARVEWRLHEEKKKKKGNENGVVLHV